MLKKIRKYAAYAMIGSVAFTSFSCSEDEGDDGKVNTGANEFIYDNTTYEANDGLIADYGAGGYGEDDTHYNYDFYVVDGTMVYSQSEDEFVASNSTYILYVELFSPGIANFKTGTFDYLEIDDDWTDEQVIAATQDKYFFESAEILFDMDDDGDFEEESEIEATAGKVTVSGTDYSYTITYDLTLDNGKTLKGSFTGTFEYVNND